MDNGGVTVKYRLTRKWLARYSCVIFFLKVQRRKIILTLQCLRRIYNRLTQGDHLIWCGLMTLIQVWLYWRTWAQIRTRLRLGINYYSGRKRARIRNSVWVTWQFLIGVNQCGGHSLGLRLSFGIECTQTWSAGPRINDNQAFYSLHLSFELTLKYLLELKHKLLLWIGWIFNVLIKK